MKKWLALAFLFLPTLCYGQGFRYDNIALRGANPLQGISNAVVTVCTSAGTGLPCAPIATTYTDATLATPCPAGKPVVLANTNTCVATADNLGNFGFWVAPSATYIYTITATGLPGYSTTITVPCPVTGNCNFTGNNTFGPGSLTVSGAAALQGLLTTGTGTDTSGVTPNNLENICGSAASPSLVRGLSNIAPCTHTILYYGASTLPPNGYAGTGHRTDLVTATGYDVQSPVNEYYQTNCQHTNSGGIINDNSTLCSAVTGVSLTGLSSTASVVASDFVGKSFTTAPGTRLIQANQNLCQTARNPGWVGDTTKDYSPCDTVTLFSGSLGISAYMGFAGAGSVGAKTGEFVADTVDTAHAIWHGTSVARPDNGYWCGAAITSCEFIGAGTPYTTNQANQPLYSDSPTYGVVFGERAANNGQSNLSTFFSTNAGTPCTLLAAPNGATEVGNVSTYTCNAAISGNFAAGSIAHITGVGQSGYNIDCVIQSVASPSFTCNNSNITTAQFAISGASESAGTVTITTTLACPFTTGETVTISNVINANPTTNNGYNGPFTVLAPGCNGGSTFTYTNTVTGLPTCASVGACTGASGVAPVAIGNPLPASGAGTATASARQAFSECHDNAGNLHWDFSSPPSGNCTGNNVMNLSSVGGLSISGSLNVPTGNITTANIVQATFRTNTASPATAGQFRLASTDTIDWLNNAGAANIALSKTGAVSGTIPADTLNTTGFGGIQVNNVVETSLLMSNTSPTIAGAGCGGTVAAIQNANGTASFDIFTGTAPTSGGCTITLPAAAHHWHCEANHTSAISTTNFIIQQTDNGASTTSVTLQLFSDVAAATAPAASDTWRTTCTAN